MRTLTFVFAALAFVLSVMNTVALRHQTYGYTDFSPDADGYSYDTADVR